MLLLRSIILVTGVALASSCSSPPKPAPEPVREPVVEPEPPADPEPAPPTILADITADADAAIALPVTGTKAPWLEEALSGQPKSGSMNADTVASGARASVIRTPAGQHFAFHADAGAVGELEVPAETIWLGFGKKDELLAADKSGAVFTANSLTDWKRRGTAPKAILWDASPSVLAASDGFKVWVSKDGGKTFGKPFKSKKPVRNVLVREPQTVVIELGGNKPAIMVSSNGGKRFAATRLRVRKLERLGPWIWNNSYECPAVLSADNKTWIEPPAQRVGKARTTSSWRAWMQPTTRLDGYGRERWATPSYPKVPTARAGRRIKGTNPCRRSVGVEGGVEGGVVGGVLGGMLGRGCEGLDCLRSDPAPSPAPSKTGFFMLRDAACKGGTCRANEAPRRLPHTAFIDQESGQMTIGEVPAGCVPARILSNRGLGLLLCREKSGTSIWSSDSGQKWVREHSVTSSPKELWNSTLAADGTLVLQRSCPRDAASCTTSVRRPLAVGESGAWYDVTEEGALTHRALVGGRVLVVHRRESKLILSIANEKETAMIGETFAIEATLTDLAINGDGTIRVDGSQEGNARSWLLSGGGKTIDTKRPAPTSRLVPFDPSHRPGR